MRYYWQHVYWRSIALTCALDLAALTVVAAVSFGLLTWSQAPAEARRVASGALLLGVPALCYAHGYTVSDLADPARSVRAVLKAGAGTLALVGLGGALGWLPEGALGASLASLALAVSALALLRWKMPAVLARRPSAYRVLVLGDGDLARRIGRHLKEGPRLGVELAGFLDPGPERRGVTRVGAPVLGAMADVERVVQTRGIDHVVLACSPGDEKEEAALLDAWGAGVPVESGLAFYERLCGRLYMRRIDPQTFAMDGQIRGRRPGDFLKRLLDLVGATLGLILATPLLAVAALAIRLESPGDVLFRQARIGRHGRVFGIYKLRTMRSDAESSGARWAHDGDDRITRVGRWLRKTRVDELPQLWNVLRGEMSLVGPRPERPEFAEPLTHEYPYFRLRSLVKPGLTGWAQIRQGYVNDVRAWENKLELDLYYVKNRSLVMDLLILLQTTRTLILMRGV